MNELDGTQQKELINHLRDVMQGNIPMEHPGAPPFRQGEKYAPTTADQQFEREMRTGLFRNAFFRSILWGATPALLFNIPQVRSSFLFRNSKSPIPAVLICGFLGYGRGILEGSNEYAKKRFQLENSPISRETRWKVYQMNPTHTWLQDSRFQHEFEQANRRAQMQQNRRREDYQDYPSRQDYPQRSYNDRRMEDQRSSRYDDRRYDDQQNDAPGDDFSMDDWFHGGNEGGKIPESDEPPRRNEYMNARRNRFNRDEDQSKSDQYHQNRREFDRSRSREEDYDRGRQYSRNPGRGVYGQRDEDFVTQADFEMDDDKFVSSDGRRRQDGW